MTLTTVLAAAIVAIGTYQAAREQRVHFDPDTDPSRINWTELATGLGAVPDVRGKRFGVVLKTVTNDYWRLMAEGYRRRAVADGVRLDIQAARSESDPIQQLSILENMIGGLYEGLLVSPMSDSNLAAAIDDAFMANLPIVDVDGAVVDNISHFVGAVNSEMGARVATWFVEHYPNGGKLAIITGQPGVYSSVKRTAGFQDVIRSSKLGVVAVTSAYWDRGKAYGAATDIIRDNPDLIGIYCNNDTMALGAVDAVEAYHKSKQIKVFGTDGTRDAYVSIQAGAMTGTVDIFPVLTAEFGLEVAERLAGGQRVPRVIETPQQLITSENIGTYVEHTDLKALLRRAGPLHLVPEETGKQ